MPLLTLDDRPRQRAKKLSRRLAAGALAASSLDFLERRHRLVSPAPARVVVHVLDFRLVTRRVDSRVARAIDLHAPVICRLSAETALAVTCQKREGKRKV